MQEHVKPLRALLKAAGYRPAPRTTATTASACSELAGEIGASAPAAAAGYPTSVLDSAVPAAPGSAGAAAAGYKALQNSLATSEPASVTGTGYEALLTSLSAAGATGPAADSDTAAAAAMASTPAAATSPAELLIRYQLLGRLLRVDDFVHPESGRKVQLVVCRDPQVGCMAGCEVGTLVSRLQDQVWFASASSLPRFKLSIATMRPSACTETGRTELLPLRSRVHPCPPLRAAPSHLLQAALLVLLTNLVPHRCPELEMCRPPRQPLTRVLPCLLAPFLAGRPLPLRPVCRRHRV